MLIRVNLWSRSFTCRVFAASSCCFFPSLSKRISDFRRGVQLAVRYFTTRREFQNRLAQSAQCVEKVAKSVQCGEPILQKATTVVAFCLWGVSLCSGCTCSRMMVASFTLVRPETSPNRCKIITEQTVLRVTSRERTVLGSSFDVKLKILGVLQCSANGR